MNEKIKIFFVDLDGTLLDERRNGVKMISQTNKKAIQNARATGTEIVISTGRIGKKAHYWLRETDLDYAILGNGSQIIDRNLNVLKQLLISEKQVNQIIQFCRDHNLALKIDETRIAYGVTTNLHRMLAEELLYQQESNYINAPINQKAMKIIVWGKNVQELKNIITLFKKAVPDVSIVAAERGRTLEITHIDATKGKGNQYILQLLKINKENSAHIGDTMNDVTAIEYVGKFIAMGDAAPDLLEIVDYISDNHHRHGVAKVLGGNYWKNPFKIEK